MNPSLRTCLSAGMIGGVALLLLVFDVVIYTSIRSALEHQFDSALLSTARMLSAGVEMELSPPETETEPGHQDEIAGVDFEFDVQMMPEFHRAEHPAYFQLWRQDGGVAARSASLGGDDLDRFAGLDTTPEFRSLVLKNRRPGRAVGLQFLPLLEDEDRPAEPAKDHRLTLVVARDAGQMQSHLLFLRRLLATGTLGIMLLALLATVLVVRRGLKPLQSLSAAIAAVDESDLSGRLETGPLPIEIAPIRERLNDLLERLERSFNRERRFTADVAHELRTPLAGLRSTLEVALSRDREGPQYRASLRDCSAMIRHMETSVGTLLTLARIEAGQVSFACTSIGLAERIVSCWRPFAEKAREKGVRLENRVPAELTCQTDPDYLALILTNLLENAVTYVNPAGDIQITAGCTGPYVEIAIANSGCTLSPKQAAEVFDRFWQGDPARSKTGSHCGLGLALVQKIVRALQGTIQADIDNAGRFTIRLRLPAGPPDAVPGE
ncbi:MAG: HAMP domain-containing histidine kinase [Sedimentisphaerales bacterium]|nr:HAMP domain-containing histidine kinase [Sedimentisphaerales bacterium]